MKVDIWTPWGQLAFLPPTAPEYAVLGIFALLFVALLIHSRQNFARLSWPRVGLFSSLALAAVVVNRLLVASFPDLGLLPPPGIPSRQAEPIAPLLGAIPIAAAGAWLGPGPAMLVGIATGVARAAVVQSSVLDVIYFTLFGFLAGSFVRQAYAGRLFRILRQPSIAVPLCALLALPAQFASAFARVWYSGLSGVDYAMNYVWAHAGPVMLESVMAGITVQLLYSILPSRRPASRTGSVPPHARSLFRRQIALLVPLLVVATAVFSLVATRTALSAATIDATDEMARDARSIAAQMPYFVQTGQSLLSSLARADLMNGASPEHQRGRLRQGLRTIPFFDQLILVDASGVSAAAYPPLTATESELTGEENLLLRWALSSNAAQVSDAYRSSSGAAFVAFLAPVPPTGDDGPDTPVGALVGRTRLDINPVLDLARSALGSAHEQAEAFVVDSEGRVIVHTDPSILVTEWRVDDAKLRDGAGGGGGAAEVRSPRDGTRQLAYSAPVDGHPWSVVILLPYSVLIGKATRIAAPLLLTLLGLGLGLAFVSFVATRSAAKPLLRLANDADRIASGDLTRPVEVRGDDEVDAVAQALERVRVRLRGRLDDLSLLLELSRAVSSTLDIKQGLTHVLEGALRTTQAQVARVVVVSASGAIEMAVGRGEVRHGVRALDRALAQAVVEAADPLEVEDVTQLPQLEGVGEQNIGQIRSVIAVPVRSGEALTAFIWVGYREHRTLDSAAMDVLSTLAGQTAILVDTSRSYRSANDERRLLSAILESTSDGVLVTDGEGRLVRCNRAAEDFLGVTAGAILGGQAARLALDPAVANLFHLPLVQGQAASVETKLHGGRICTCSVFLIVAGRNERLGRVVTIRDVTVLRDLERSRSRFIDRVSRDIRRPLTLIHGYATMLAKAGTLGERQRGFVASILESAHETGRLVQDLRGIEDHDTVVSSDRSPVALSAVVARAVEAAGPAAGEKGVFLRTGHLDSAATAIGDAAQLRYAIDTLVRAAISAAAPGDPVRVGMEYVGGAAILTISAGRDSGAGVTTEATPSRDQRAVDRKANADGAGDPGVAAATSVVESHGGELRAHAHPSGGITYTVTLPSEQGGQPW